ncbi:aminoglycoside 6-adenylyltransferase [Kribbella shirazensis]|uniref:Putative nucleotidyltransferase n=1 Tax=Kribbella shirazensis TaxID=1105143 RepID=A0A7X5V5K2_9ACTN|nr:nucleotidyltransferase domain-containing protein [Kribbella shirazensis]NIK55030.1 putative nucleotidyltransferase [Kribbella shirazensis]
MTSGDERQQAVITRAQKILPGDERVLAVYLIGSYGAGTADRFSDVDVHLVVTDDSAEWFEQHWDDVLRELTGPTVLADRLPGLIGGLGITPDWLHVDLIVHPLAQFDRFQYDGVRVLFDRDGTLFPDGDIAPTGGRPGEPYWPATTVNLFFYFLGNLVTVLGRDERIVANQGIGVVRDQLVALMLAERGVRRTSGAKRLNALLSDEQRAALEAIPAAGTDPADVIAANRYICREFITRGTALAELTASPWPTEFVNATLSHLRNHFHADFA